MQILSADLCRTGAATARQDVDDASMEIADAKLPYGYDPWHHRFNPSLLVWLQALLYWLQPWIFYG